MACGVLAGWIARNKNRDGTIFLLLGIPLGVIAIAVALLMPAGELPAPTGMSSVVCPRCNARQNITDGPSTFECWQCRLVSESMVPAPTNSDDRPRWLKLLWNP